MGWLLVFLKWVLLFHICGASHFCTLTLKHVRSDYMRKWIAMLIMVLVSANFYISIKNRAPVNTSKKDIPHVIEEIQKEIDKSYPTEPIEVINLHNRLMDILYGKKVTDENIKDIVELQRKLYLEELLALNSLDTQVENVQNELIINEGRDVKVINSKVTDSYYDSPEMITVLVTHYTNKNDISREYILRQDPKEEKRWKIYGWQDITEPKIQEE